MNADLALRDIHLPGSVSWWPPAPGWWLLLAVVVVLCLVVWALRVSRARRRLQKQALLELDRIEQAFTQHQNKQQLAADCSALLRRVSMSRFNRNKVAGLTGAAWLEFLDQHTVAAPFKEDIADALLHAPYQQQFDFNSQALLSSCRRWLEQSPAPQGGQS